MLKRLAALFLVLFCSAGVIEADEGQALSPKEMGGVVLALSGGGTKGLAHIGVLQVLEKEGIPVVGIVGTSMGAIMGGLAASGYSGTDLERVVLDLDIAALLQDRTVPAAGQKGKPDQAFFRIDFDKDNKPTGPLGVINGTRLLNKLLSLVAHAPVVHFDDLPIPFAAVATDLETGEMVILREGGLATAMRASMAIPGVFEPWPMGGRLLVDGGLVANIPVRVAKEVFPGYPVIAVDVSSGLRSRSRLRFVTDVLDQGITIMTRKNIEEDLAEAALVLRPAVGDFPTLGTGNEKEIVRAGRKAAEDALQGIRTVASSAPLPGERRRVPAPLVKGVRVEGVPPVTKSFLERTYASWIGEPVDPAVILDACVIIGERDDVGAVGYQLDPVPGGVEVVLLAQEAAPYSVLIDGYTSNLDSHRWLYLTGLGRNLFREGDLLRAGLFLSDNLGLEARYFSPVSGYRRQEIAFSVRHWETETRNAGSFEWDRYTLGISRTQWWGLLEMEWGIFGEYVQSGVADEHNWGPQMTFRYGDLDDLADPTRGSSIVASIWWADCSEFLWSLDFTWVKPLREDMRLLVAGGVTGGNSGNPVHGAYLGSPDDLRSLGGSPLYGDYAAWFRVAVRRLLLKGGFGSLYGDFFAAKGAIFNDSWTEQESPWEIGVALSMPGQFLGGSVMVLYDDRGRWTFGFELGGPYQGHKLIP